MEERHIKQKVSFKKNKKKGGGVANFQKRERSTEAAKKYPVPLAKDQSVA